MQPNNVLFKEITPACPGLAEVLTPSIGFPTSEKIVQVFKSYSKPGHYLIGAFIQQILVGAVGISTNKYFATIRHIAVLEAYQHLGIGKQLLKEILNRFSIQVLFAETNDDAYGFYQHCQFQCSPFLNQYGKRYACYFYKQYGQTMEINEELAKKLIQEQFPQWNSLQIDVVKKSGWDNRTFHLGPDMLIRIPRDAEHAPPILKEYEWLPKLAKHLSIPIATPIALGQPSIDCPWHWSIYRWIEGETICKDKIVDIKRFAKELGLFLKEFQAIDANNGPLPGPHNFYRGGDLKAYDHEMQIAIPKIKNLEERQIAKALWQEALSSHWKKKPVWVHGDFASSNILIQKGRLKAIIDFGQLAIGDPACDLVIAWNFFSSESREIFKSTLALDKDTWMRALGWAFWKTLCWPVEGTDTQALLKSICLEYQSIKA